MRGGWTVHQPPRVTERSCVMSEEDFCVRLNIPSNFPEIEDRAMLWALRIFNLKSHETLSCDLPDSFELAQVALLKTLHIASNLDARQRIGLFNAIHQATPFTGPLE